MVHHQLLPATNSVMRSIRMLMLGVDKSCALYECDEFFNIMHAVSRHARKPTPLFRLFGRDHNDHALMHQPT